MDVYDADMTAREHLRMGESLLVKAEKDSDARKSLKQVSVILQFAQAHFLAATAAATIQKGLTR